LVPAAITTGSPKLKERAFGVFVLRQWIGEGFERAAGCNIKPVASGLRCSTEYRTGGGQVLIAECNRFRTIEIDIDQLARHRPELDSDVATGFQVSFRFIEGRRKELPVRRARSFIARRNQYHAPAATVIEAQVVERGHATSPLRSVIVAPDPRSPAAKRTGLEAMAVATGSSWKDICVPNHLGAASLARSGLRACAVGK
jgi:hypothetical protein